MTSTATANSINGTGNPLAPPLTTDDLEDVLMELNRYEKSPEQKIPNILERFVMYYYNHVGARLCRKPLGRSVGQSYNKQEPTNFYYCKVEPI